MRKCIIYKIYIIHIMNEILSKIELKDYENFALDTNKYFVYSDIFHLLEENPNIKTDDNVLIYLINRDAGFGSVLLSFISNFSYMKLINSNIICLPHFSKNGKEFKYHQKEYNNSFFLYFKYNEEIDITNKKIFFANTSSFENYTNIIPPMKDSFNKSRFNIFNEYFTYNNYFNYSNSDALSYILNLKNNDKKPLIGIHLRSRAQLIIHPDCRNVPYFNLQETLFKLKKKLDDTYKEYNLFIATDTNVYLNISSSVFNHFVYLSFINRINTENDFCELIEDEFIGYKLGSDILNDVYCLSLCDKVYMRYSNVKFLVSILNKNIDMDYLEFI